MSYNYTTYRGGWSSSICDLFSDPRRRANCCAMACFGLLLSDRNAHLMLDEQRPSWSKRFLCNLGFPVTIILVLNILQTFLATDETVALWQLGIWIALLVMVAFLLYRAKFERMQVRRAVMTRLYEKRRAQNGDIVAAATPQAYLQLHSHDVRAAHATCSCFPKDMVFNIIEYSDQDPSQDAETSSIMTDPSVMASLSSSSSASPPPKDICTCLWNWVRALFCGVCGSSWIQCCGMCAIGQEDREIAQLLEKEQLQVDYITFQPYTDYYGNILKLIKDQNGSLVAHWQALSLLSYNLVKLLSVCLVVLTVVALLELDPKFQIENLIVVLATFGQAFLILWLVHFQWHRFDLSVDALVKYFASGFCLCTFLAIIYEVIISSIVGFLSYMVVIVGVSQSLDGMAATPAQVEKAASEFAHDHVGIFSFFVFLNAFVVAAMVEEMSKYFGYWMVETPDLMDPDELVWNNNHNNVSQDSDESPNSTSSSERTTTTNVLNPQQRPKKSRVSRGAGITVAMVTVAAGFACSENLLYVFVYTPPGLTNEIATLVARSMFPIHPLCAAIQSIGIVARDLEGNGKWQLGRSIFPAVLLHGAFDFCLMFLALLEGMNKSATAAAGSSSKHADKTDDTTSPTSMDQADQLPMYISVSLVIVGILYYCCEAARQRKRLMIMDQEQEGAENLVV